MGGECGCGFIIYTPELDRCGGFKFTGRVGHHEGDCKEKTEEGPNCTLWRVGAAETSGGDMGLTGVPRLTQQTSLTHTGHGGSGCLGGVSVTMLVTHGTPAAPTPRPSN